MTDANFRNVRIKYMFLLKKSGNTHNHFSNSHLNYSFLPFLNFPKFLQRTNILELGRARHTFNLSIQEAETSGSL